MAFDRDYYERYYFDEATRAVSADEQARQGAFIAAYLRYLEIPVTHILDVGCGLGRLLHALAEEFPGAVTKGIEYSDYLCEEYGWDQASVVDYEDAPYDLVICSDVLGYLDKRDCRRAIGNLAKLTTSALYLTVMTLDDLDICDEEHTDMNQKLRPHEWYAKHLDRHFASVGGGLFLRKPLKVPVWRLERA